MSDLNDEYDEREGYDERDERDAEPHDALLEEELRQAAAILDPVPAELRRVAVDAFALHDLDARVAELTFDSLLDGIPVRGWRTRRGC